MAFTVEILPFIWSIITHKGTSLAFKDLAIIFVLGYVMYLVNIVYKAFIHKINKNKSHI